MTRHRPVRGARALLAALVIAAAFPARAQQRPTVDEGSWPMPAHDVANTRFSPLDQIDTRNAHALKLAFSFATGTTHGNEAAPIVVGSTMYVATPFPNTLYAFDLTKPGAHVKWKFEPHPKPSAQGVACCDTVNRGVAYDAGRIFMNTLDGDTVAIDAASGEPVWRTHLGDVAKGETMTMAPFVVKGKVIVGNSGGEMGVRGWLTALDEATGKIAWRAYSTGPDADVRIGPRFKPHYAQDQGKDLGVTTWPPQAWKTGGGNAWGWVSYDPELDLLYYGTANPGPWDPEQRPGANKWTSGVFARDPASGDAIWFYQWSPHDLHDYDGVNENVLVDLEIGGRTRKVLLHADRNGYLYVLDRATGEVLSADAFAYITTTLGVDLATGGLRYNPAKEEHAGKPVRDICPGSAGGKDWQPSAWSPRTRLLYIPGNNLCQDAEVHETSYIAGTPYVGADLKMHPGPGGYRGEFTAWDPVKRRKAWSVHEYFPVWSGALATAGDVVFYGTMDGWFKALDARTGKLLWKYKTSYGIVGQPVTYRGPDGKQYVAILDGVGGWAGAIVSGDLDPRDATAGGGFVNAMKDLPKYTRKGGTLYVFALP